uniref:Uncharacterized protein n=1 Tax=Meleagris gallopavo TaxID=9103 RepID=D4N2R1_MELGA|nr:hypothetical protein [Meleagris gallopavo]
MNHMCSSAIICENRSWSGAVSSFLQPHRAVPSKQPPPHGLLLPVVRCQALMEGNYQNQLSMLWQVPGRIGGRGVLEQEQSCLLHDVKLGGSNSGIQDTERLSGLSTADTHVLAHCVISNRRKVPEAKTPSQGRAAIQPTAWRKQPNASLITALISLRWRQQAIALVKQIFKALFASL